MNSNSKLQKTISTLKCAQEIFREFAKAEIKQFKKGPNMELSRFKF